MANVVQVVSTGPFMLALMSDNTIWQANPAVIQPLAWTQLPAWGGTGTLKTITAIRMYATPVVTDSEAYVPCVLDGNGNYYAYDENAGTWRTLGTGPP
jgi:hypothetical protein